MMLYGSARDFKAYRIINLRAGCAIRLNHVMLGSNGLGRARVSGRTDLPRKCNSYAITNGVLCLQRRASSTARHWRDGPMTSVDGCLSTPVPCGQVLQLCPSGLTFSRNLGRMRQLLIGQPHLTALLKQEACKQTRQAWISLGAQSLCTGHRPFPVFHHRRRHRIDTDTRPRGPCCILHLAVSMSIVWHWRQRTCNHGRGTHNNARSRVVARPADRPHSQPPHGASVAYQNPEHCCATPVHHRDLAEKTNL